jgi:hypothetical protein
MIRTSVTDRTYRVYTYQPVDRVPDIEFGYWPQTIRRWLKEGMPLEMTLKETEDMFSPKLDAFFGFEAEGGGFSSRLDIHPAFEEQVLERKAQSVIMRDTNGIVAERYQNDVDSSSIPHYLEFPVKDPTTWAQIKERYRLDDPFRQLLPNQVPDMRREMAAGKEIRVFFMGFYGRLRDWIGTEALSLAFYDYPGLIHEMVAHWADLCVAQLEQLPPDIVVDRIDWWEDMAGKAGPLVGPRLFRKFLQPGYQRVMDAARQRGCILSMVDCDGNPHDLVQCWLEVGVNIMFPLEVAAGVDAYAWRAEFGKELRLRGGIAKAPLVAGGAAIDRELERIRPLLEQGGYIPHLDHLVPPDIPYAHYCDYLDKKRKLIGR